MHLRLNGDLRRTTDEKARYTLHEQAGDLATQAGCFELAYRHYKNMLSSAEKLRSQRSIYMARTALAETAAVSLNDFTAAIMHQAECVRLCQQLHPNDTNKVYRR